VAPAGSVEAGGEDIGGIAPSITLQIVTILALDTSSAAGSAALVRDGTVIVERAGDGSRTHGQRLPRELMAVLREGGATLADVDGFAIAIGPGSFTGLRVGIATMQGLALAGRKRLAPISTFEALAFLARAAASPIAVWIDAHRAQVFATLYAADGRTVLAPPTSLTPEETLDAWMDVMGTGLVQFAGDGAMRYAADIRTRLADRAQVPGEVPALAGGIGVLAAADAGRAVTPHAVVPLYVRRPDVELARERLAKG
jgi:tRNA threonylcarbamoyladenosine biosynthesis protein TsaB